MKLFDFGLATELPEKNSEMNGVYEMSSQVGSLRYMAPEVAKCKSYNEKVDVYSFGTCDGGLVIAFLCPTPT